MPKLAKKKVGNKFQEIDKIGAKKEAKNWRKKISFWAKKCLIPKGFTKKLILKPKFGQKWQKNMQKICNSTYCPAEGSPLGIWSLRNPKKQRKKSTIVTYCPAEGSPLSLAGCSSTRILVSGALWILKKTRNTIVTYCPAERSPLSLAGWLFQSLPQLQQNVSIWSIQQHPQS